jgi:hypothetical protein
MKKIALFLCCISSLYGTLPMELAMSKQELEQTGINRLSSQQKRAFERWLESWTHRVLEQSSSYHPSVSLEQWVREWPEYTKTKQKNPDAATKSRQEANQRIFRNNNGKTLELHDGSEWSIRPIDVKTAIKWKRDEPITITTSERDIRRPYILTNSARNEEVGATKVRSAHPYGEKPPEPASHFEGSVSIKSISADGTTVLTEDNKSWKIAPINRKRVETDWRVNDRIRVQKSKDALYRYSINNLDSGDSVLANPIEK